jgi:hypothetical protein
MTIGEKFGIFLDAGFEEARASHIGIENEVTAPWRRVKQCWNACSTERIHRF